jgi:hypothetical protein
MRRLARALRHVSIMAADRSVILFKNNTLLEWALRMAGQELRVTVQGLPSEAMEMRQCR